MITHLHIENYRCLRDVAIDLGAFTVLVGANDSGKSSILDAIRLLGRTTEDTIADCLGGASADDPTPFDALFFGGGGDAPRIAITALGMSQNEFSYHVELHRDPRMHHESLSGADGVGLEVNGRTGPAFAFSVSPAEISVRMKENSTALRSALLQHASDMPELVAIARAFRSSAKYQLDPQALRRPASPLPAPVLAPSGENLAAVLDGLLTGSDHGAVYALQTAIARALPTLSGVGLRTIARGRGRAVKTIELTLNGNGQRPITIPAAHASDGALLLLAFLALAYSDTPDILLLEDPGLGLHPSLIRPIVELLQRMSTGEVGRRPRQVILATHSPILLNYVKPAAVRILRRDPKRGTNVTPMTDVPNIGQLLVGFHLGEVWSQLAEDGLLQGR